MMKILMKRLWFLPFIPFLIWGCPLESEFPLSKISEAKIDQELIGTWQPKDEGEKEKFKITFYQFNDREFLVLLQEKEKEKPELYKAFVTIVSGEKFLNVQEIELSQKDRKWNFVNYSVTGDDLRMRILEDKIFKEKKINTTKALLEFIRKNLKNKDLYGPEDKIFLKRVKK